MRIIKKSEVVFASDKIENDFNSLNLPDRWRLIYSITTPNKVEILTIILEWFNHKVYERRFHY